MRRTALTLAMLLTVTALTAPIAEAKGRSRSRSSWHSTSVKTKRQGACPTASSVAANGSRCGARSAYDRGPTTGYDSTPTTVYRGEYRATATPSVPAPAPVVTRSAYQPITIEKETRVYSNATDRETFDLVSAGAVVYTRFDDATPGTIIILFPYQGTGEIRMGWIEAVDLPDQYRNYNAQ